MSIWMLSACLGPWNPEWDLTDVDETGSDTTPPDTTPTPPDSGTDSGTPTPGIAYVTEAVTKDTVWTNDRVWQLQDIIFVEGNVTLTVEAGTTVLGEQGSALVVTRGSRLVADGTVNSPIVFSSAQPVGQRAAGDWGGVVLLGEATVAGSPPWFIEGLDEAKFGSRGEYGGADDAYDCGRLRYVRIEFAGFEVFPGNELNGLTVGGCGDTTFLQYIHVHLGLDDGIEFFGGTAPLKFALVTGAADDSFDFDEGWTGRAQFLLAQQYPNSGDKAVEGDGILSLVDAGGKLLEGVSVADQTYPRMYNLSFFAPNQSDYSHGGIILREGTRAELRNVVMSWQTGRAIDIDDSDIEDGDDIVIATTTQTVDNVASGEIVFTHSAFFGGDTNPTYYNDSEDPLDEGDDHGFNERNWLESSEGNSLDVDLGLAVPPESTLVPWVVDPAVHWVPPLGSPAVSGYSVPEEDGFWDSVSYMGAVAPGTSTFWWETWTSFPPN